MAPNTRSGGGDTPSTPIQKAQKEIQKAQKESKVSKPLSQQKKDALAAEVEKKDGGTRQDGALNGLDPRQAAIDHVMNAIDNQSILGMTPNPDNNPAINNANANRFLKTATLVHSDKGASSRK